MQDTIGPFRAYLKSILEAEMLTSGGTMREMLERMQQSTALPEFYFIPARERLNELLIANGDTYSAGLLFEELSEAIKAVYGEWMREGYRGV